MALNASAVSGKGVNMILDCVGGSHAANNLESIAVDGQWVLYGLMGGVNVPEAFLGKILRKRIALLGTTLRARSDEVSMRHACQCA